MNKGIYSENGMRSYVEAVGTFQLVLKYGFILDLENIVYVLSFFRNLVSIAKLVPFGFSFNFTSNNVSLLKNNTIIGHGFSSDGLYKLILNLGFKNNLLTLHDDIGIKHCIIKENSSMLWHRR